MTDQTPANPRLALLRELGDPTRLRVVDRLSNVGEASVTQLSVDLGVPLTTLSNHLRRLRDAHLIAATRRGRHVIYTLADPGLEALLLALDRVTGRLAPEPSVQPTPRAFASTCYDHAAGELGVRLFRRLVETDAIRERSDGSVELGDDPALLERLGVSVPSPARRRFAFECLDAIHHRPHLGGALGAAVLDAITRQGWVTTGDDRVLTVTDAGLSALNRIARLELGAPPARR
ncbi:MAG: ArsR/SmtB family transcription factor [Solirubrobacteraceae bacterium]